MKSITTQMIIRLLLMHKVCTARGYEHNRARRESSLTALSVKVLGLRLLPVQIPISVPQSAYYADFAT